MIDSTKRTTLKILAVTTGTVATTSAVHASAMLTIPAKNINSKSAGQIAGEIEISTRLSAQTEELEIVLTNSGHNSATIKQITPAKIHHEQGDFNLQSLLANGPITLEAGESAAIGLGHHSLNRNTALHHSAESLSYVIRNNVSVVADSNAFV